MLLAISLVMQVALLLVQLALRDSARDFINDNLTAAQFDDKLGIFLLVIALAAIASIAQLVLLIIWTFRLAKNHQVLNRHPQSFKPGGTIAVNILGGCTLGILNYFMWRELWRASDPDVAPGDPSWTQRLVTPLLPAFLALTLGGVVARLVTGAGQFPGGFQTSINSSDLAADLADQITAVSLGGVFTIAAAAVFLMIVRQLSVRHVKVTGEA